MPSLAHLLRRLGHAYDADLALWNFSTHGPFQTVGELTSSPLLQPLSDGLRFTVVRQEKDVRRHPCVCALEAERVSGHFRGNGSFCLLPQVAVRGSCVRPYVLLYVFVRPLLRPRFCLSMVVLVLLVLVLLVMVLLVMVLLVMVSVLLVSRLVLLLVCVGAVAVGARTDIALRPAVVVVLHV